MAVKKVFFKYNPATDGDKTFNIEDALNKNWDAVNEGFTELEEECILKEEHDNAMKGKANTPSYVESTMLASGWDENRYSFEADYPFNSYDIEIQPSKNCTTEQMEAYCGAMLTGSSADHITEAKGDVPTIDIPIMIKVVRK